jgi:hypothetical protein
MLSRIQKPATMAPKGKQSRKAFWAKWARVDSQDKEASQVYLESLEVKV